jgi:hypothetical protein
VVGPGRGVWVRGAETHPRLDSGGSAPDPDDDPPPSQRLCGG